MGKHTGKFREVLERRRTGVNRAIVGAEVYAGTRGEHCTEYTDDRIYADRWNAPVIVTTSVKFFGTMMAARESDLRRLHSVANAVVVFDECPTLVTLVMSKARAKALKCSEGRDENANNLKKGCGMSS